MTQTFLYFALFAALAAAAVNLVQCVRAQVWIGVFVLCIRMAILGLAALSLRHAQTDLTGDRNSLISTCLIALFLVSFFADIQKRAPAPLTPDATNRSLR